MSRIMTVSDVRRELQRVHGFGTTGEGAASTAALGRLFHRIASELLRSEGPENLALALREHDASRVGWRKALINHTYYRLLGPLLTAEYSRLQGQGQEVWRLWQATQALCEWLADIWLEVTAAGEHDVSLQRMFRPEEPLQWEIVHPEWTESVLLVGTADAILKIPGRDHWCLLEWKLGQTRPELDLAQACLYHYLASNGQPSVGDQSRLAVISFHPHRAETSFAENELTTAKSRLIELIGALAGVRPAVPASGSGQPSGKPPQSLAKAKSDPGSTGDEFTTWVEQVGPKIIEVATTLGVPCKRIGEPIIGPRLVRFMVQPLRDTRVQRVLTLGPDLHVRLQGHAGVPQLSRSESYIAIDIPHANPRFVEFSSIPEPAESDAVRDDSRIPVGVDLNGNWVWCDLASAVSPHLLVCGTTGSGKSQWLRSAVAWLMRHNTPETLQLVLIDPKRNAFRFAEGSPLVQGTIRFPGDEAEPPLEELLEQLVAEMRRRTGLLGAANAKDLNEYRARTAEALPRIVLVCDEYADLLTACGPKRADRDAFEQKFVRLAQVGRATGIHLILATQQPRANIINTGLRSLLPVRVALRVNDGRESNIALDGPGADLLLGQGDLIYKNVGDPIRLQGAWLSETEELQVAQEHREEP